MRFRPGAQQRFAAGGRLRDRNTVVLEDGRDELAAVSVIVDDKDDQPARVIVLASAAAVGLAAVRRRSTFHQAGFRPCVPATVRMPAAGIKTSALRMALIRWSRLASLRFEDDSYSLPAEAGSHPTRHVASGFSRKISRRRPS